MKTGIIGDPGKDWTDHPRALTESERDQIKVIGYLDGVKLHRQLTNSTLSAAAVAVRAIQK